MRRPAHKPDELHRRQVEALAGYGVREADIAGLVGIDAKTLRKHYRHELDFGHTKAKPRSQKTCSGKQRATAGNLSRQRSSG